MTQIYLRKNSVSYRLARLLWEEGLPVSVACDRLEMNEGTARSILFRLRQKAAAHVGYEVTDVFALRMVFDPDAGKNDVSGN